MVLKELILTVSTVGRCGSLQRIDFTQFLLCKGVAVLLDRTDFNSFYFVRCGSLERTGFNSFDFGTVHWS